ncbi:MAG: ribonuclease HII [bacterium]|nr:ribonuclease HII [bacterium]
MAKKQQIVFGVDEVGRGCERPDAEILTRNGWKKYTSLNRQDEVLSYNNGSLEWQKIKRVVEKEHEGILVELKNRGIHIVVSPDHYFTVIRRVFKRGVDDKVLRLVGYRERQKRVIATELKGNDFIPRGGAWNGGEKDFILPKVDNLFNYQRKSISIDLWVKFFGLFLSEGSICCYGKGNYRVTISQRVSSSYYKEIHNLLQAMPFKFSAFSEGFSCHNKQLYFYLKQFGKCYTQFIPANIKDLNSSLLNTLIEWMIKGDGSCYTNKKRKTVCTYYTTSRLLRDDFEEILLKAGWTFHTVIRERKDSFINGRPLKKKNKRPCFEIRLRRNNKAQIKFLHKKTLFYKGKVFCLQLSKYHNFYVRRSGSGYFTGNSLAGPVVACAVYSKKRLDSQRDSKQLSAKQREEVFSFSKESPNFIFSVSKVGEKVIDKINIFEATKLAMVRAVMGLEKKIGKKAGLLLIDGNFTIPIKRNQQPIIKGDEKIPLIALASIVAKVNRDNLMQKQHKKYPQYGFAKNKGYGTRHHINMLNKIGPCKIHRTSFAPVNRRVK